MMYGSSRSIVVSDAFSDASNRNMSISKCESDAPSKGGFRGNNEQNPFKLDQTLLIVTVASQLNEMA